MINNRTKILVPVDGSKNSMRALDYAINLAKKYTPNLCLLHVATLTVTIVPEHEIEEMDFTLEELGNKILEECYKETRKNRIDAETVLLRGHPGSQIVQYANAEHFDIVIMGNKGQSADPVEETYRARYLLGSVSRYVVKRVECSVIIVK